MSRIMLERLTKNRASQFGLLIIAFLVAVGVACFVRKTNFSISREIDLISLLDLFATFSLALYITRVLAKRDQQERVEKDILLVEIKDFKTQFTSDIRNLLVSNTVAYSKVIALFKTHRQSIHFICECAKEHKFLNNDNLGNDAMDSVKRILDLFTSTAPNGTLIEPGITILNDTITLPEARKRKIQNALAKVSRPLFDLVAAINRS